MAGLDATGNSTFESRGVGDFIPCGVADGDVGDTTCWGVAVREPCGVATFDPDGVAASFFSCGVPALELRGVICFEPAGVPSLFSCGVAALDVLGVTSFGVPALEPFGVGGLDVCGVAVLEACLDSLGVAGLEETTGAVSSYTGVPGLEVLGVPG